MKKLLPLRDKVVIRRLKEEAKTESGLFLPESATEKPNQGVVVAVGQGIRENGERHPLSVKEGETVIFGKYADSNTVKINDEELIIVSEKDIYAVIEG